MSERNEIKGVDGRVFVSRQFKDGKLITKEDDKEERIEVARFHEGVEPARVGFGSKMVINLGNFESCHISVEADIPCHVEEMGDAFEFVKDFVDKILSREYRDINDHRKKKIENEKT